MREYSLTMNHLAGGLNLWDRETDMGGHESPWMENLWWEDGGLCSREGQEYVTAEMDRAVGFAASPEPFWDHSFFHISGKLWAMDHTGVLGENLYHSMELLCDGVPQDRGSFFRYGDHLYYKNRGGFYQIAYTPEGETLFTVKKVEDLAYTPTILLNADPEIGSGDLYQPENRLTGRKRVKYSPAVTTDAVERTGDGVSRIFSLGTGFCGASAVYIGTELLSEALYEVSVESGTVTLAAAPAEGETVTFLLDYGVCRYKLPVGEVEAVEEVRVEGQLLQEGTDYTVDLLLGAVEFAQPPAAEKGPNTVEILYRKENPEAKESVMSCRYGGVYGGGVQVCMVLGGSAAQPNALFWNGNTDLAMDPGYWPMPFYNLCGDSAEGITGFGRQYTELIIFKESSIGKAGWSIETVNGRDSVSLTYQRLNDRLGCDLPGTIQLVENNLVFAHSARGVCVLRSASAAYENNVVLLSQKINGSDSRPGLLYDLRVGGSAVSLDDGQRYWLGVNGHVYLWDYRLSGAGDPAWFYFTGLETVGLWLWKGRRFHLNAQGRVTKLGRTFSDYGGPIPKAYTFPLRSLGDYRRRKGVTGLLLALRGDADCDAAIAYRTDWEQWTDPTPIRVRGQGLAPRDLTQRDLSVETDLALERRSPRCRRVRCFGLKLENHTAGQDLAPLSLQILWRKEGRER